MAHNPGVKVSFVLEGFASALRTQLEKPSIPATPEEIQRAIEGLEAAIPMIDAYCAPGMYVPPPPGKGKRKGKGKGKGKRKGKGKGKGKGQGKGRGRGSRKASR